MSASPRRKRARKYISLREKLAAALSMLLPQEVRDELRERQAPAKEVIGMFEQDHNILHALGGSNRWWNLTPTLRAPHRVKSAIDTAIVAKVKRIRLKEAAHLAAMLKTALDVTGIHDFPLVERGIGANEPINPEMLEARLQGRDSQDVRARPKRRIPSRPFRQNNARRGR